MSSPSLGGSEETASRILETSGIDIKSTVVIDPSVTCAEDQNTQK